MDSSLFIFPTHTLYFIDRKELLEMYFTSTGQHVVSAQEQRFLVIRVGSTLIKKQTGSFLCLNPATVPSALLRAGVAVGWWQRAVGAPALGRGWRGATGSSPGPIRRSRAHKTPFFFFFNFFLGRWVTARRDFGFICSRVFLAGGGHCISGEAVVRDERCFWQGVCSLLMTPEILIWYTFTQPSVWRGRVDIFSPAVLKNGSFPSRSLSLAQRFPRPAALFLPPGELRSCQYWRPNSWAPPGSELPPFPSPSSLTTLPRDGLSRGSPPQEQGC